MDTSLVLSIIGLIATIVFGFLSIVLFRRKKYPGKLTLVKQSVLGLFNDIAKNFAEIGILYKGDAIKENVIYLKACFINDGDMDIDGNTVEKTISLRLNSKLKWIKSVVSKSSQDLACSPEISSDLSELKFNFGLIRKKEFFQFEALIETLQKDLTAEDIFENITITHRIANTQKIKIETLLDDEQMKRKRRKMKSFMINVGLQLLVFIGIIVVQLFYFKSAPIQYTDKNGNKYEAKATTDGDIKLTNVKNDTESIIPISEFQKVESYKPFIPNQSFWEEVKSIRYILPILVILMLLVIGMEYYELRKSNKIYDILSKTN